MFALLGEPRYVNRPLHPRAGAAGCGARTGGAGCALFPIHPDPVFVQNQIPNLYGIFTHIGVVLGVNVCI